MAFIKIISLPSGNGATCTKYYYAEKDRNDPNANANRRIAVGEVAEVPDDELEAHLATGKVMQVSGPTAAVAPKRGRPAKTPMPEGFDAVMAAQR